jgi:hypothetical protein
MIHLPAERHKADDAKRPRSVAHLARRVKASMRLLPAGTQGGNAGDATGR